MPDLLTMDKSTGYFPLPNNCKKVCKPHDDNCKVDTHNYQKYLKNAVQNQPKQHHHATQKCLEKKYCTNTYNYMNHHCNTTNLT